MLFLLSAVMRSVGFDGFVAMAEADITSRDSSVSRPIRVVRPKVLDAIRVAAFFPRSAWNRRITDVSHNSVMADQLGTTMTCSLVSPISLNRDLITSSACRSQETAKTRHLENQDFELPLHLGSSWESSSLFVES